MRSSKAFVICVLGFSMGFSVAATVPLLSTLDKPFYLRAARPAQERVILNFVESFKKPLDGVLIFSSFASNTSRGPQLDQKFKLTDGKLFTADNSMSVFLPSFPPGPLLPNPLVFGNPEQVQSTARLPIPTFAAQTVSTSSQESKLQLISLLGDIIILDTPYGKFFFLQDFKAVNNRSDIELISLDIIF